MVYKYGIYGIVLKNKFKGGLLKVMDYDSTHRKLDAAKLLSKKGGEYWMGRDIQEILGYSTWKKFSGVIDRAMMACESAGGDSGNYFYQTVNMVSAGSGTMVRKTDYYLTRYACYLIAMNGASSKPEIGIAQTYFAAQTRRQERFDQLTDAEKRLHLRNRVKDANKSLMSTAKKAGVNKYPIFQAAGYHGLYEMDLQGIKQRKGLTDKDNLLDRAGRTELAANEFRITQTEDKLIRERINTEQHAIETHKSVGSEVRGVINRLGGTMPEDLPPEEPINQLTAKLRKGLIDAPSPQAIE